MEFFKQYKGYAILLGGILVVIVGITIFSLSLLLSPSSGNPAINVSPTPTGTTPAPTDYDPYSEAYKKSVEKIHREEKASLQQDQKVAAFLEKLPQQGTDFTAKYDIATNRVTVTIPTTKRAEGENEFNDYLLANGIPNSTLLPNFTIRYRDIDPSQH